MTAREDQDHRDHISYAKVVILGSSGVGKSSIIEVITNVCLLPQLYNFRGSWSTSSILTTFQP